MSKVPHHGHYNNVDELIEYFKKWKEKNPEVKRIDGLNSSKPSNPKEWVTFQHNNAIYKLNGDTKVAAISELIKIKSKNKLTFEVENTSEGTEVLRLVGHEKADGFYCYLKEELLPAKLRSKFFKKVS